MATLKRNPTTKSRKLVVVGDGMSGKTCLLYAFKDDTFDPTHPPTIFEAYAAEVQLDDRQTINLALYDTAGQEIYSRLRPLSYPDTNVILICFCVANRTSLINVIQEWAPEVRHFCGACPVILVACQIDLRTDRKTIEELKAEHSSIISTDEGKRVAAQIKADDYMECSAKTREGVHDLFMRAARLSLQKNTSQSSQKRCFLF